MRIKIRTQLLLYTFLTILLVVGTYTYFTVQTQQKRSIETYSNEMESIAESATKTVQNALYYMDIRKLRITIRELLSNSKIIFFGGGRRRWKLPDQWL